jgi:predicted ribonuclease YlaK
MERLLLEQQAIRDVPGHRIILDTSVLMEAVPPVIEFDWHSVHESMAVGSIRLIVPIIVIEELDEKLHDRDADRRKRARDAIRSLRSVHKTNRPTERAPLPDKPDVTLEILMDE